MMPFCRAEGLGIMTYSPLAVGLLTGLFRYGEPAPGDTFWGQRSHKLAEILSSDAGQVIETVRHIAAERDKTPAQVATAWILSHPEISAVIIGPDTPEQAEESAGAIGWALTVDERAALDEVSARLL